ncbi:hypothetical protein C6Y62_09470 [Hyphomicrobium sulfonivorans]|nr:hypothetical protein [Hyphomicrobium sulfonivorans]
MGLLIASGQRAEAICAINAASLTVSPLTAGTGTYTPPTVPGAQAVTFTISGTYLSLLGGLCTVGIAFQRGTLPATMSITGGGTATLPYAISTAASGGTSLLYTSGTPASSSLLKSSFNAPILGVAVPFSTTVTAYFSMQPSNPQRAGTYSDGPSLTVNTFNVTILDIVSLLTSTAFTVTGSVTKTCTISGVSHPSADAVTIPVSAAGAVNTSPIVRNYANASCNTPANVQLTSQNAGARTASTAAGFSSVINYTASGAFFGAVASINTSTSSTGPISGPVSPTTGTALPSGTLTATINPTANTQPLMQGAYTDVLSITITPQ